MNAAIKTAALSAFAALGTQRFLHRTVFRDRLTIVTYHAVVRSPLAQPEGSFLDETSFRRQIKYLKKSFAVISLSDAVQRLKDKQIERPTAVITFDDGFQNNYDVAFPILLEEKLPATLFLSTGFVDTEDTPWFCRLHEALSETRNVSLKWDGHVFELASPEAKVSAAREIKITLKRLPHVELVRATRQIVQALGDDPDRPIAPDSPFRMLSRTAIKKMAESGLIEFGSHTHSHAIVSRLSSAERREEIERSVRAVKELTGRPCELFAYPNGGAEDYDAESVRILQSCGVRAAVTGISGPNDHSTPLMELRRYGVVAGKEMARFELIMHHFVSYARRWARLHRKPAPG